jgi:cytochrome c oxidase subunit I
MNQISSVGAWITGVGSALFIGNMIYSAGRGKPADMRDPFQLGEQYYDHTRKEPHH